MTQTQNPAFPGIEEQIKRWGKDLGFQAVAITDTQLDSEHQHYHEWLDRHYHGEMAYMSRNVEERLHPEKLVPDTISVICVRLDYLTQSTQHCITQLDHPSKAYVSRYALGRDYHKLMRKRLQKLARMLQDEIGEFGFRVFTDSAPVLEKALAAKAGIGWIGKHSNVLHRDHSSWFFLGEIYTDVKLASDHPVEDHCGDCQQCIELCPTRAIVSPYVVDSRRCISYLTIEHHSAIPTEFRAAIGNRIYGCDDCQLYCPWNRFERQSLEEDFQPRQDLDSINLVECFEWTENDFLKRFEGSPIRRIGFQRWRRNLAVALGNAAYDPHIVEVLQHALGDADDLVKEHCQWALEQQRNKQQEPL